MGLFKSREEKELDSIIQRLEMNMSNNYKDNAQEDLKELEEKMNDIRSSGNLKTKSLAKYEAILDDFREKMKGYSHKDQRPYWH
jgi:chromosome segregation ATPase